MAAPIHRPRHHHCHRVGLAHGSPRRLWRLIAPASVTAVSTTFPAGFLWGTATAAHHVEGANWNNDWWAWEHDPSSGCTEPSGDACDHYHRVAYDLRLLASFGFTAFRFSLAGS